MTSETELIKREHTERLRAMTEDKGDTWDLSRNDVKAIRYALSAIEALQHAYERLDTGDLVAESLKDEIRRLDERLVTVEQERAWQPIETAPKDGTVVFVVYGGGAWRTTAAYSQQFSCWEDSGGFELMPTHWMPLPPPPSPKESA